MRVLGRSVAVVALAGLLLPALLPAAARAGELLVMRFTCSVVGGQPVLTPGPQTGHRILGNRDQRKHQVCSPVNPEMCRQWIVHRFDLDCDGQRVSWVAVVAASNEGTRRAWLLDGRLLLRMGPRWSLAPDDPCAQEQGSPGADERPIYGGRLQRECAQRLALAPPPVVEMPFGYAPMLGIDAIFVTAKAPPPGAKTQPPMVAGAPPPAEVLREPKAGEPKAKEPPPTPPVPQPAPKVASAPKAAPTPPSAAIEKKAEAPPPKIAAPPSPPKEAAPPASHGPRPVTLPPAPPGPEGQKQAVSKPDAADASPAKTAAVTAPAKEAERQASTPKAGPESGLGLGLPSLLRPSTTGALVAFAGLALGLLAAFALARRREHAKDAGRRRRNMSAVSLDGRPAQPARDPRGRPEQTASANPAKPAPTLRPSRAVAGARPSLAISQVADWGDRMPRTREEAFEVLGIGIAPSATAPAIKKIVDGLRMSWHPDLAQDETDRALREQRSKQINAAWEILQGERAEV